MLNYETLLSSYDDKLTLMQWLKKVEKALAGASASSFEVIKTGNATIRFRINFEDGTYLESGDMVLQQGESVSSGEIRNGHLYLTLTNGQELDCGELFNGEIPNMQVRSLEVTGGLIVGDDANATIGGDLVVHGLTEVQNILAYGHVETETLTATGDKITAEKPVVENMEGYSFEYTDNTQGLSLNVIYASVAKNGNKLTFAIFGKLTRTDTMPVSYLDYKLRFYIPSSIGVKLVPSLIGGENVIENKTVSLIPSNDYNSHPQKTLLVYKPSNGFIVFNIYELASLTLNTEYAFRIEQTFLLSENLVA